MDAITPPSIKERPIIFSAAMVRAILEGRKTQTRRVVKPQPVVRDVAGLFASLTFKGKGNSHVLWPNGKSEVLQLCPYGQPGDRLWVRESWRPIGEFAEVQTFKLPNYNCTRRNLAYRAEPESDGVSSWRPSIHMPRWASRITLEIVSVRVERLQEISRDDCIAEGAPLPDGACRMQDEYRCIWEGINGKESWAANPWVWVVEFKRVDA